MLSLVSRLTLSDGISTTCGMLQEAIFNKIRIKREETQSDLTYENSNQTLPQDEAVEVNIQPKQVVENESNSIKIQDDEEVSNAIKQSQGELPSSFFEKFMWSFVAAGVGLVGGIIGCVAWYFWTKEW